MGRLIEAALYHREEIYDSFPVIKKEKIPLMYDCRICGKTTFISPICMICVQRENIMKALEEESPLRRQ